MLLKIFNYDSVKFSLDFWSVANVLYLKCYYSRINHLFVVTKTELLNDCK